MLQESGSNFHYKLFGEKKKTGINRSGLNFELIIFLVLRVVVLQRSKE